MKSVNMTQASPVQESPLVSVIIAAYNVEDFIGQAVNSALSQTVSDLEIIVVDDGSQDGTGKVVEQFSDERLRMIRKSNGGCASARNAGVAVSRGKIIAFLDGDDYWFENKLERQLEFLDHHPGADLIFCLSNIVDEVGQNWGLLKPGSYRSFSFESLLIDNPVGNGSAAIMHRKALDLAGPFDESLPASSDVDMWLRVARIRPDNIVCLPEILTCYRRRSEQTTGNWKRMQSAYELVFSKARHEDPETVQRVEQLSRCHKNRYHAFIAYEAGELKEARRLLMESMKCSPWTFILTTRSRLLGFAIFSKSYLPAGIHSSMERFFTRIRRNLYNRKISRQP